MRRKLTYFVGSISDVEDFVLCSTARIAAGQSRGISSPQASVRSFVVTRPRPVLISASRCLRNKSTIGRNPLPSPTQCDPDPLQTTKQSEPVIKDGTKKYQVLTLQSSFRQYQPLPSAIQHRNDYHLASSNHF